MARGSFAVRRLTEFLDQSRDAFDNDLVRTTRNNADLAAHYSYTPERHRFYRNGSRELLQYEDLSSYQYFDDKRADEEDVWILQPDAGDTLTFRSAERFRYTVNFVSEVTQAFAINQALANTDDRLTIGLDTSPDGDLADGYFLEQLASHDDDRVDLFAKRNGSVIGDRTTVTLRAPTTTFQRPENDYNWYNVGVSRWRDTVTEVVDGARKQLNTALATLSSQVSDANSGPGGRGPISGNGQIVFQLEADASTTGLELYAGSMSFTTLGDVGASVKGKGAETPTLSVSQSADWEPLGIAFRKDPNRPNVNLEFRTIEVTAGEGKVMLIACDPSNVLNGSGNTLSDSDFDRPEDHSAPNSVLEVTPTGTVAEIPGADGTTGTTQTDPGGYQLALDTTRSSGQGQDASTRSGDLEEKHGVHDGDYAVPVAKPTTTDAMRLFYVTEMDE